MSKKISSTQIQNGYVTVTYCGDPTIYPCSAKEALRCLKSDLNLEEPGLEGYVVCNGIVTFWRDWKNFGYLGGPDVFIADDE